jgi:hypothetical protein
VFFPHTDGKEIKSVSASELIVKGRFSIPRTRGLLPAKYRIAVFAGRDDSKEENPETDPEKPLPEAKDKLPARFNLDSELEVEIKPRSVRELRVDIESK